jgi:hypothetical protein
MRWDDFTKACPDIAVMAENRFKKDQLAMLGTLRKDGFPRISPCEMDFANGHLFLSMMWRSPKALDLLRDPRIVVHSVTCNKDGTDGDIKIYGRVSDINDPSLRTAFREAIMTRTNWAPSEPEYHLFSLDVDSASFVAFDGAGKEDVMIWEPGAGLQKRTKAG